jgi:hypothetical protein
VPETGIVLEQEPTKNSQDQDRTIAVEVTRATEVGTVLIDRRDRSEGKGGRRMIEGRGEREKGTPDVTIDDPADTIGAVAGGDDESGERATGTPNTIYNLASVLFHALQGGASYDTYVEGAEQEGDEELSEFFRRVREEDRDRAAEARMLLAERTPTASRAEEATADVAPRAEPSGDLSDIEPRAEGASPGDARRTYAATEMPD